jgi:hypothetical protein
MVFVLWFCFRLNSISETGFYLRLCVEPNHLGQMDGISVLETVAVSIRST